MRKGLNQSVLFAGGIVLGMFLLIFIFRGAVPGETSYEAQAIMMSEFIARSVSSLSSMEQGMISKQFEKKADIEIYKKKGVSCFFFWQPDCGWYAKISYMVGDDRKSSESRVFGDVNPVSLKDVDHIYVVKEPFRAVDISALSTIIEDCVEPGFTTVMSYVDSAVQEFSAERSMVLSIIETESRFSQCARSGAGAIGLMQLMPSTADGLGVDPYNPQDNVRGGTKYYTMQLRTYGSKELALAAYNAGPGRVNGWRDCIDDSDATWSEILSNVNSVSNPDGKIIVTRTPDRENECHMPLETRNYVPINMCYYNSCYAQNENRCNQKCRSEYA